MRLNQKPPHHHLPPHPQKKNKPVGPFYFSIFGFSKKLHKHKTQYNNSHYEYYYKSIEFRYSKRIFHRYQKQYYDGRDFQKNHLFQSRNFTKRDFH